MGGGGLDAVDDSALRIAGDADEVTCGLADAHTRSRVGAGGGLMQQRAGRRWGVGGGSAGQSGARRGESEEAREGVKRTLAALRDAAETPEAASTRGPRPLGRSDVDDGTGRRERDDATERVGLTNPPITGADPHAMNVHLATP